MVWQRPPPGDDKRGDPCTERGESASGNLAQRLNTIAPYPTTLEKSPLVSPLVAYLSRLALRALIFLAATMAAATGPYPHMVQSKR